MSRARRLAPAAPFSAIALTFLSIALGCSKKSPDLTAANAATKGESAAAKSPGSETKGDGKEDNSPPPGVDLTKLDEFERKIFFRVVNKEASACGKGHSLIHSVRNDRACRKSLYAARYVARLVDSGFTDSEIGERLTGRYRGGAPKKIDLADAPVKGNANAPIAVVEFVDFECPACRRVQPVLRQLVDEYPNEVKVIFKHYPLPMHTNARTASEAAAAAHKQGKFWAFTDKIWANADSITAASLEQWAKESGLDVTKWRKEFEAEETKARVEKDKSEGRALGVEGTPTIFINGRQFTDAPELETMRDWVNEELNR